LLFSLRSHTLVTMSSRLLCIHHYFFFFFQAEDGIRDRNVTGVQTCALPISPPSPACPVNNLRNRAPVDPPKPRSTAIQPPTGTRSEERRVGKECRSRWWPDQ